MSDWVSASVSTLGYCLKEENLEELNSDDQGNDLDRLNIICIKEEDPEDDDYLCKAAGHIDGHSVTPPMWCTIWSLYTQNKLFKARHRR